MDAHSRKRSLNKQNRTKQNIRNEVKGGNNTSEPPMNACMMFVYDLANGWIETPCTCGVLTGRSGRRRLPGIKIDNR